MKYTLKDYILGAVYVIYFVSSIAGMSIADEFGRQELIPIILGQVFLVNGIIFSVIMIKEHSLSPIILLFPIAGLLLIVGGLGAVSGDIFHSPYLFPVLMLAFFFLAAVLIFCGVVLKIRGVRANCTCETTAKCIDVAIDYTRSDTGVYITLYNPVYSLQWRGQEYILQNHIYTQRKYEVGKSYKIRVNPENVEEYVDDNFKMSTVLSIIIGSVFLVVSIVIIVSLFMA